jgi:hypothetical protein
MLDDADLDALLDLAIARFVSPAPLLPPPDGLDLHQVKGDPGLASGLGPRDRSAPRDPAGDRLALVDG